jgi:hypothetical protein
MRHYDFETNSIESNIQLLEIDLGEVTSLDRNQVHVNQINSQSY